MNVEIKDKKLLVHTPQGRLVAYASSDPYNPGIYIDYTDRVVHEGLDSVLHNSD